MDGRAQANHLSNIMVNSAYPFYAKKKQGIVSSADTNTRNLYTAFVHKVKAQNYLISDLTFFELPRGLGNPSRSEDIWSTSPYLSFKSFFSHLICL